VGRATVQRDDCTLTVRRVDLFEQREQPVRVVIDSNLNILKNAAGHDRDRDRDRDHDHDHDHEEEYSYALFKDGFKTIVYHSCNAHDDGISNDNPNVTLVNLSSGTGDQAARIIQPLQIIQDLQSKNIRHIMVEGGPATAIQFLNAQLVDRAIIIRAPVTFIEPVLSGMTDESLVNAGLELIEKRICGDDVVEYWVKEGMDWPTDDVEDWPN